MLSEAKHLFHPKYRELVMLSEAKHPKHQDGGVHPLRKHRGGDPCST